MRWTNFRPSRFCGARNVFCETFCSLLNGGGRRAAGCCDEFPFDSNVNRIVGTVTKILDSVLKGRIPANLSGFGEHLSNFSSVVGQTKMPLGNADHHSTRMIVQPG